MSIHKEMNVGCVESSLQGTRRVLKEKKWRGKCVGHVKVQRHCGDRGVQALFPGPCNVCVDELDQKERGKEACVWK